MANPLTREELEAIKEREKKATPGPWRPTSDHFSSGACIASLTQFITVEAGPCYSCGITEGARATIRDDESNASFIAYARQDIPSLLSEVERLREENEGLRKTVASVATLLVLCVKAADESVISIEDDAQAAATSSLTLRRGLKEALLGLGRHLPESFKRHADEIHASAREGLKKLAKEQKPHG